MNAIEIQDDIGVSEAQDKQLNNYTPSPAEAEFDGLTAGLGTIQLCL